MSQTVHKKKFGSEFLCKTRYRNALPLPPFAPKLLALPSSTERCIKFQATGLSEATTTEMVLDNQWALPIDLIEMRDNFFGEGRRHDNANAALNHMDEMLLTIPIQPMVTGSAGALGNGSAAGATPGISIPNKRTSGVSWLRRTEYISNETPSGSGKGAYKEPTKRKNMVVDNSREGQIAAIQKTFERFIKKSPNSSASPEPLSEKEFLASLRHPTKPDLTAVDSIPIFPDFATWGNAYTHMTFDVDPEMNNERSSRGDDEGSSQKTQRSSNALIKPMSEAGNPETWLSYYLPDNETAKKINHRKRVHAQRANNGLNGSGRHDDEDDGDEDDESEEMVFTLQRDYTYTTLKCDPLSTLVFTFRDIPDTKHKAAFYNPMQSRLMLRKKRAKRYEDDDPPITHIDAKTRRMNSVELAAKREALQAIDC